MTAHASVGTKQSPNDIVTECVISAATVGGWQEGHID